MKLSVCMIVKNEEEHLRACLESVVDHVDEIVIVDTGSTDSTPEIAKEFADVYDEVEWTGFSAARNRSIELATGDVFMILDADETLRTPEAIPTVLEAFRQQELDGVSVLIYNHLPSSQVLASDTVTQLRFFWNRPEARYEGKVHNQIADVLEEKPRNGKEPVYAHVNLVIDHMGYGLSSEKLQAKYRQRTEFLKEEVRRCHKEGNKVREEYYRFQTANAFFMMKDYDLTLAWARKVDYSVMTAENQYACRLIASHSAHILGLGDEAFENTLEMVRIKPGEALTMLFMGMALMLQERWFAGYVQLGGCLAVYDHLGAHMKYDLDRSYVCGLVGECAIKLKRYEDAKLLIGDYLKKFPDDVRMRALFDAIIPVDQATPEQLRAAGLPVPDEKNEEILVGEGEEIEIPVAETIHSQPLSGQNLVDDAAPI